MVFVSAVVYAYGSGVIIGLDLEKSDGEKGPGVEEER